MEDLDQDVCKWQAKAQDLQAAFRVYDSERAYQMDSKVNHMECMKTTALLKEKLSIARGI